LGALSLGDIGKHFPNTDARYHNIASRKLLFEVMKLIQEREYKIVNIDSMVIADHPKLAAHIPKMCTLLSQDLGVQIGDISIKATTKEGCAPEGIAAHAVVLLTRNK
jgi:2-C-methyl-D-erythritol 2,4-cyclodiphosphate synthase